MSDTPIDGNTSAPAPAEGTTGGGASPIELNESTSLKFRDGETDVVKSWKELQTERMLHKDYTQKRQADAEARRQFDSERQAFDSQRQTIEARERALSDVLQDDQKFAALVLARQARHSQQTADAQQNMSPAAFQQWQEQMRQNVVAQMQNELQTFRKEQASAQIESDLNTFTRESLKQYPLLQNIDGIEDAVFGKVAALRPSSIEEAKEQIRLGLESRHQALVKNFEEKQKQDLVAKKKATEGVESGSGRVQLPDAKKYKSLGDKNLTKDMTAFFEEYFKNQE